MPERPGRLTWLPNALTVARVGLVALTYLVVVERHLPLFIVMVLLAVLTDILDGPIARRLGVADRAGANLDSAADFVFYLSLPLWAYMWRPEDIVPRIPLLATYTAFYVAALVALHFRKGVIGLHNRWTRIAGTSGVFFALYVVAWGWSNPFMVAILVLVSIDLAQRFLTFWRSSPKRRQGAEAAVAAAGKPDH